MAWEEQSSPFCWWSMPFLLVEYVQEMQDRIDRVTPIIFEHMEAAVWRLTVLEKVSPVNNQLQQQASVQASRYILSVS